MKLAVLASALLLTAVSQAATVVVGNVGSPTSSSKAIVSSTGAKIANLGGVISVGFFNGFSDAQISALSTGTLAAFASAFQPLAGTATFGGAAAFSQAGLFKYEQSATISDGSAFIGKNIYTVIGNNATIAGSTEFLVIKSALTFDKDNPLFTATINVANDVGFTAANILFGESGKHTAAIGAATNPAYTLKTIIPEPSSALLGLLGLMGGLARRRRK